MTKRREIPFARPWITDEDRRAVARVLDGPILTHGPECKAFEAEFAAYLGNGAHAVSVSSCMAALHLSYLYLGIGPGDEVIVPAMTHVATAHAVEWVGARPVFADCDPATGNLTADRIARAITSRTRAISVVHFAGIPCAMPAIVELARDRRLAVVEDCALAVGARYDGRPVGLFGDAGCFSFYPAKHMTTGEGGMFVSRQAEVAEAVARLRAFGVDRSHGDRRIAGMYDVPSLGLNYRMAEMPAALGRSQLARLPEILVRREENFRGLREGLSGLDGVRVVDAVDPRARSSFYCLSLVLDSPAGDRRDMIALGLAAAGIGTSIYYPQPVPRMRYYRDRYGYDEDAFRQAARIADRSLALPVGPHVAEEDIEYMIETLRKELEARS